MRKHGFQFPLNFYQIFAFCLFVGTILVFNLIVLKIFTYPEKVTLVSLFFVTVATTGFLYILVTITDPSDYGVEAETEQSFCSICNDIRSINSKHCVRCDRCTLFFDHHCKWVNNCIGKRNYRCFIGLVAASITFCGYFIGCSVFAVVFMVKKNDLRIFEVCIILFFVILCLLTLGFLVQLALLHIYLNCHGMSTYEFIIRKRRKIGLSYKKSENINPETHEKTDNINEITRQKD